LTKGSQKKNVNAKQYTQEGTGGRRTRPAGDDEMESKREKESCYFPYIIPCVLFCF
jgi:hypothetical protein